jgi:hypothetical protein
MKSGGRPTVPIRAVWFDVGETLIDESRQYGTWADWLRVPRHTFSAMFGAVIAFMRDIGAALTPGKPPDPDHKREIYARHASRLLPRPPPDDRWSADAPAVDCATHTGRPVFWAQHH